MTEQQQKLQAIASKIEKICGKLKTIFISLIPTDEEITNEEETCIGDGLLFPQWLENECKKQKSKLKKQYKKLINALIELVHLEAENLDITNPKDAIKNLFMTYILHDCFFCTESEFVNRQQLLYIKNNNWGILQNDFERFKTILERGDFLLYPGKAFAHEKQFNITSLEDIINYSYHDRINMDRVYTDIAEDSPLSEAWELSRTQQYVSKIIPTVERQFHNLFIEEMENQKKATKQYIPSNIVFFPSKDQSKNKSPDDINKEVLIKPSNAINSTGSDFIINDNLGKVVKKKFSDPATGTIGNENGKTNTDMDKSRQSAIPKTDFFRSQRHNNSGPLANTRANVQHNNFSPINFADDFHISLINPKAVTCLYLLAATAVFVLSGGLGSGISIYLLLEAIWPAEQNEVSSSFAFSA